MNAKNSYGYRFYERKLSRQVMAAMIRRYGFIECAKYTLSLIWLNEKTGESLKKHDNGSEYFRELRMLKNEIEYTISIEGRPV